MAPHPERKPAPPSLHPRVPQRGVHVTQTRPAKPWRVVPGPCDALKQDKMLLRRHTREATDPLHPDLIEMHSPLPYEPLFPFSPLEEPTRNLEDVGRGVAHKLRSGLCALKGGLQMSLQQMLPGPTREMLALAERGAHHITEIVKDLVLLTQRPAFHPRPVDINLLLGEFLNGLRRHPEWEGVTVTRRLDGSLPLILGDPDLLDTVFDAVARNAAEAMAPRNHDPAEENILAGSDAPPTTRRLAVETSREGDSVVVRITDSGAGLTEETMELAFQPYFSTKSGRKGMGLPLARWLIHVHGGSMSLQSRLETGTTVTFRFPEHTPFDHDRPAPH